MSTTTNYGLYVENNAGTHFKDVRERLYGEGLESESNMEIIDRVLGDKAGSKRVFELTLNASGWSESYPYTQELTVTGLDATDSGIIGPAPGMTIEQSEVSAEAALSVFSQNDNAITIQATGDKPTCDIPVVLIILG